MPIHLFKRFRELGPARQRLLREALVNLLKASIALRALPFRRAIRWGSISLGPATGSAEDCVWAVIAVSRRVPWRSVCIHNGLAVQRMLRARGLDARLHYGIGKDEAEGALQAHVWITLDDRTLIGEFEERRFSPVAVYP